MSAIAMKRFLPFAFMLLIGAITHGQDSKAERYPIGCSSISSCGSGDGENCREKGYRVGFRPLPKRFPTFILICSLFGALIAGVAVLLILVLG